MLPAVETRNLVKHFDDRTVVNDLSIQCNAGHILGLLGPNGAGKTTTLRMLYGLIRPDTGEILYEGQPFAQHRQAIKRHVGVCTQDDTIDYDLTVAQNLRMYASYFRPRIPKLKKRIRELLSTFKLEPYANSSPRALSGGFKQRLMIARSIVHKPKVLFLDEPTTGLDPQARVELWQLIRGMREVGMAIILTTHYMDEAERLSDSIVVMNSGQRIAHGTPRDVLGNLLGEHMMVIPMHQAQDAEAIRTWATEHSKSKPSMVLDELRISVATQTLSDFSNRFPDHPVRVRTPNLEDLFLALSHQQAPSTSVEKST